MTRECLHVIDILSDMEKKYNDEPDLVNLIKDGKVKVLTILKSRDSQVELQTM